MNKKPDEKISCSFGGINFEIETVYNENSLDNITDILTKLIISEAKNIDKDG